MPRRAIASETARQETPAGALHYRDGNRNDGDVTAVAERIERREAVARGERRCVEAAKQQRDKQLTGNRETVVVKSDGRNHLVRRVETTASKMVRSGRLPADLKSALDAFAKVVARALGAAVDDGESSTARFIAAYENASSGGYGSRTPKDSVLDARTCLREIGRLVPPELVGVFEQVVAEEVGSLVSKPRSLEAIGNEVDICINRPAPPVGHVSSTRSR